MASQQDDDLRLTDEGLEWIEQGRKWSGEHWHWHGTETPMPGPAAVAWLRKNEPGFVDWYVRFDRQAGLYYPSGAVLLDVPGWVAVAQLSPIRKDDPKPEVRIASGASGGITFFPVDDDAPHVDLWRRLGMTGWAERLIRTFTTDPIIRAAMPWLTSARLHRNKGRRSRTSHDLAKLCEAYIDRVVHSREKMHDFALWANDTGLFYGGRDNVDDALREARHRGLMEPKKTQGKAAGRLTPKGRAALRGEVG